MATAIGQRVRHFRFFKLKIFAISKIEATFLKFMENMYLKRRIRRKADKENKKTCNFVKENCFVLEILVCIIDFA